jgi:glyceraldehyde 3-phosphate dehydrogenase
MSIRVGINGFGRMGRLALRAAWDRPELEFAHITEPRGDAATAAHLLSFDSVHGRWSEDVQSEESALRVQGSTIGYGRAPEPTEVPWGELGVEIVLECSGRFRTVDALDPYFDQGVRKVIVAAPVKGEALNIVVGVNDGLYEPGATPTADRGLVHDKLPGTGRQGDPRGDRHRARADHDAA